VIISKTPYRISFFGGGSDYPSWYNKFGGEVISSTIDKYIYISCRKLPRFFYHNYRIVYSKTEEVKKIKEIKHRVVRLALLNKKISDSLEIHYDGDLPARSGMGSSSAFVVGLLNILNILINNSASKMKLAKESVIFEQKILKECVGSQDQIACTIGGFNSLKFYKDQRFTVSPLDKNNKFRKELNKNLILLYTGQQRIAQNVAKKFVNEINNKKKSEIKNILEFVAVAKKLVQNYQYKEFGILLDESWKIKKKLHSSITNSEIDFIYNKAKFNGAIGGKILGAGGGGFLLFYVPKEKKNFFIKKMDFLINVPFQFENFGSQIILK
jgi:D-glycero-alpha-D-manno-heptose-7-phosphate kinase